ncbi:MAG TPA: (Fe-S)-binding protein, partial [Anaerolineales bacterium]|nr:(Fe-S)-binding protein [Anaerolineales bacterium]
MAFVPQLLFVLVLASAAFIIRRRVLRIRDNIRLGKSNPVNDCTGERWSNVLLVAFGQKKMFKKMIPAVLHFFIYAGFLIINLEVLEFVIDGLAGTHRIFAPYLGSVYNLLMNFFEFLALAVLLACVVFLLRRNVVRVPRFRSPELTGWPLLDANLILITEIVLMTAIFTMNACDQLLQTQSEHYTATGTLFFSSFLMPLFENMSLDALHLIERSAWWFHILGILGFAIYVTYSKHLHIFMAFVNTYYAKLEPKGQLNNMPVVTREVKSMLGIAPADAAPAGEPGRFGAKDINDLTWNQLAAAYSCTECGRCTAECPANLTGKKLSPRKIMMDVRDRMEEVGNSIASGGPGLQVRQAGFGTSEC